MRLKRSMPNDIRIYQMLLVVGKEKWKIQAASACLFVRLRDSNDLYESYTSMQLDIRFVF
jgi:hypothetical protein